MFVCLYFWLILCLFVPVCHLFFVLVYKYNIKKNANKNHMHNFQLKIDLVDSSFAPTNIISAMKKLNWISLYAYWWWSLVIRVCALWQESMSNGSHSNGVELMSSNVGIMDGSSSSDVSNSHVGCEQCGSPSTTRCSRCKAVRYWLVLSKILLILNIYLIITVKKFIITFSNIISRI
jgi:hypothetical protein